MNDSRKTKGQLIAELQAARQELAELRQNQSPQAPAESLPFRQAFAQAALGMALVNPQGRFLHVNRHLCEMLGYTDHELRARDLADLTHPEDLQATRRHLHDLAQGPRVMQQERRFLHRFGHALWVRITTTLISDQQACPQYVICLFMDITRQKAAEAALQESEEKYRTIFETAGSAMVIMEEDTTVMLANSEFARLTGARPEDLAGQSSWTEFISEHDVQRMLGYHRLRRLDPGAAPRAYEAQVKDGRGGLRDCLVTVAVVPGTRRSVASLLDLTERKRAEAQRMLLATAISQAQEAVVITDRAGLVQYLNPAFERLTGFSRSEIMAGGLDLLEDQGALPQGLRQALGGGQPWAGRSATHARGGAIHEVESSVSPVRDPQGEVTNFVVVQRDITHESRLEAQLRHAQKMEAIGTLAGGVAHDFNNILASILGFSEIALYDFLEPGHPAADPLAEVVRACQRARDLAEQILTFSRRQGDERLPLSPAPVVKEALKLLRATLPTSIQIKADIDARTGLILADPTQVHQVLLNLCTNAAHALGSSGGTMWVRLRQRNLGQAAVEGLPGLQPGPHACLTVSDNGGGMSSQVLERIFEPYFTTKGPGEGTGLGLAVVHGIVKSHQGAIKVRSKPGRGATFQVYLPLAGEGRRERQRPAPMLGQAPRGRERVLLVDDEPQVAAMARTMLGNLGYQVQSFGDSREALDAFRRAPHDFELAICDQTMPHLSGAELAQHMLAQRPDLPIIICSGYSDLLTPEKARELGVRQFLKKPILRQDLALALRRVLDGEA